MKLVFQNLKFFMAIVFFGVAGLVFAPGVAQPTVTAHHCFGHITDDGRDVNIAECADAGACLNSTGAGCPAQDKSTGKINGAIKTAINLFSLLVGFASVIMIIVGGLKYVTSSGDSNNINSAKNTILYAIIGLVIVGLAQVIVRFVLSKAG